MGLVMTEAAKRQIRDNPPLDRTSSACAIARAAEALWQAGGLSDDGELAGLLAKYRPNGGFSKGDWVT